MPQSVSNSSPARPDSECVDVVGHTGSLGTTRLSLRSQISKPRGTVMFLSNLICHQRQHVWFDHGQQFLSPDLGKHAQPSRAPGQGLTPCADYTPRMCLPFFSCQEQHPPGALQPLPSPTPHHSPATMTFYHLLESSFLPRGFSSLNLQPSLHHPAPHLPTLSTFPST